MIERGKRKKNNKKQIWIEWEVPSATFNLPSLPKSPVNRWSPIHVFVCVRTCLCAVSAQVTVLSKGSLIIVGVIMEISVSLTIRADDKKKNYLFWCFCFLISCPLEISRDFYYRACVLPCLFFFFFLCSAFLHRSVHPRHPVSACFPS